MDPVFICPTPVATAKSAIVVSSVSPDRCDITEAIPAVFAILIVCKVSLTVPIWFSLIKIAFMDFSSIARCNRFGLVTVKSSPTNWTFSPRAAYNNFQPTQSFSSNPSSIDMIGY